jgi:hypothetical protein
MDYLRKVTKFLIKNQTMDLQITTTFHSCLSAPTGIARIARPSLRVELVLPECESYELPLLQSARTLAMNVVTIDRGARGEGST